MQNIFKHENLSIPWDVLFFICFMFLLSTFSFQYDAHGHPYYYFRHMMTASKSSYKFTVYEISRGTSLLQNVPLFHKMLCYLYNIICFEDLSALANALYLHTTNQLDCSEKNGTFIYIGIRNPIMNYLFSLVAVVVSSSSA